MISLADAEGIRLTGSHRTFTTAELEHWYATRATENESCNFRIFLIGAETRDRRLGTEATRG